MARQKRHSFPGAIYHIMLRGNNGQEIFSTVGERSKFCLLIQEGVERYGHKILAFCFMTNHVHLAVQVNNVHLSKIFQNLAFRYTQFYNWHHDTIGHLFQGRFKSILVDSRYYLKELIRYIHLNPVRAKLVNDPSDYQWSSHHAYLKKQQLPWLAIDQGLQFFGDTHQEAMDEYQRFVMAGIGYDDDIDFKRGMSQGILGNEFFIEEIQKQMSNRIDENKRITIDLNTIINVITSWYQVDVNLLQKPGLERNCAHIRAVTALLVRESNGLSLRELSDFFGRGENAVSQAASRLEMRMRSNTTLRNEVENLKEQLLLASRETVIL